MGIVVGVGVGLVTTKVGVGLCTRVGVGVFVGVGVGEKVGVFVGVGEFVGVDVGVGLGHKTDTFTVAGRLSSMLSLAMMVKLSIPTKPMSDVYVPLVQPVKRTRPVAGGTPTRQVGAAGPSGSVTVIVKDIGT